MRTVFALFESYREAKRAVDELLARRFDEQEMNVIVQELAARGSMDVNLRTANIDKTDRTGREGLHGLNRLVAGQQPLPVADVGAVYAAGKMATILARAGSTRESAPSRLKDALVEFDVPEEIAQFYANGVSDGGVLFWLRTDDTRAAEAANVLSETKGEEVSSTR